MLATAFQDLSYAAIQLCLFNLLHYSWLPFAEINDCHIQQDINDKNRFIFSESLQFLGISFLSRLNILGRAFPSMSMLFPTISSSSKLLQNTEYFTVFVFALSM